MPKETIRLTRREVEVFKDKINRVLSKWPDGVETHHLAKLVGLNPKSLGKMLGAMYRQGYTYREGRPNHFVHYLTKPAKVKEETKPTKPAAKPSTKPSPKQLRYIAFTEGKNCQCIVCDTEDEADEYALELSKEADGKVVYVGKVIGAFYPTVTYLKERY